MKKISQTLSWVMQGKSGVAATIQTFFFQIVIQLTNFMIGPIIARSLGPVGRGELGRILLWPQLFGAVFALGLGPALLYNLKKSADHNEESELYSAALTLGLIFGTFAAALGFFLIPLFMQKYSTQTVWIARLFVLTAPIDLFTLLILNAYKARNLFRIVNQTNYAAPVMTLGVVGALTFGQALNPLTAGLARRGPLTGIFLWKFWELWRYYRPKFTHLKARMKQLAPYSLRSAPINIFSQLSDRIDQFMVIFFLNDASLGLYIVSLNLSRLIIIIQNSILSVLFSKVASRPVKEVTEMAGRAARVGLLLSVSTAIFMATCAIPILTLYGGEKFLAAVPIFRILSLEIVLKGATLVLAQTFMAVGRPGIVSVLQGLGLGLSFPLMWILIPRYGLVGVGIALLCSTSIRLITILGCYPLILKISPPSLIPTLQDLVYLKNAIANRRAKP
ncbi:MAG: oligosaccharide flippase family protein [Cyanobacteria bacterium P01_F01_bin.42]